MNSRKLLRTFLALTLVSSIAHGQIAPAELSQLSGVQIMEPTQYHGDEIPLRYGVARDWLALMVQGNHSTLRKSSPKVSQVYDAIADELDMKDKYSGKLVSDGKVPPLLLIKAAWLQAGEVRNAKLGNEANSYTLGDEQIRIEHLCAKAKTKSEPLKCKIYFSNAKLKQLIAEIIEPNEETSETETSSIEVLWSGDLDHDGKLDFILHTSFYNGERTELFLSSKANKKEHAKLVASVQRLGC